MFAFRGKSDMAISPQNGRMTQTDFTKSNRDVYCTGVLAYGVAGCGKVIAVTVARIDSDPVVCDRLVDPTLEIAITNIEKMIALKRAIHRYMMAPKNSEDLAADFVV
jgi:hypothetical protein